MTKRLGDCAASTPLITPIGWGYAAFVWGYALAWFLVTDRVKLLAYRILDPMKTKTPSNVTPQLAKVSR
jgi:H+-transporting ATPase